LEQDQAGELMRQRKRRGTDARVTAAEDLGGEPVGPADDQRDVPAGPLPSRQSPGEAGAVLKGPGARKGDRQPLRRHVLQQGCAFGPEDFPERSTPRAAGYLAYLDPQVAPAATQVVIARGANRGVPDLPDGQDANHHQAYMPRSRWTAAT